MPDVTPDFKDGKRKKASRNEWKNIRSEKIAPCRVCGKPGVSLHHIIPRSQGGDDVPENTVPLCGSGTTGCHGLVENRDKQARGLLRARLLNTELNYVVERMGAHWLNKNYPHLLERLTAETVAGGQSFEQDTESDPARMGLSPPSDAPGGITVSPGATCPTCERIVPRKRKKTEGKPKTTFGIKVPKDAQENGHEVLTSLVDSARDQLREAMGWSETVPPYYVLTAVLHDWLGEQVQVPNG